MYRCSHRDKCLSHADEFINDHNPSRNPHVPGDTNTPGLICVTSDDISPSKLTFPITVVFPETERESQTTSPIRTSLMGLCTTYSMPNKNNFRHSIKQFGSTPDSSSSLESDTGNGTNLFRLFHTSRYHCWRPSASASSISSQSANNVSPKPRPRPRPRTGIRRVVVVKHHTGSE